MRVVLAENAGTCYGVERALDIAKSVALASSENPAFKNNNLYAQTLGPLIHNPRVVQELEAAGIGVANSVEEISTNTVILRSHGVLPSVREKLEQMNVHVEDATCPYVLRAQRAALNLAQKYGCVFVVGAAGHPEVEGLIAYARLGCEGYAKSSHKDAPSRGVFVVSSPEDALEKLSALKLSAQPDAKRNAKQSALPTRAGVVVQTTQSTENLEEIVRALEQQNIQLDVKNTICSATTVRQESAARMAASVDSVVVVGGKNSSNTTRLFEICKDACAKTYHIESTRELTPKMFKGCKTVGVSAGASTPANQINEVVTKIESF